MTGSIRITFMLAWLCLAVGCGGSASGSASNRGGDQGRVLTPSETKHALRRLPYHFTYHPVAIPSGASGAVAGKAEGKHHTIVHFGIALGRRPDPVPGIGAEIVGDEASGFVYTDDTLVSGKKEKWEAGPQFHTAAQWHEGGRIGVKITEALCLASTAEPCRVGD